MRQFARPFPIDRLSLEARVLYTAFLVFLVGGIASSVWLYEDSFGSLGGDAAARYYLGDEAGAAAEGAGGPALELPEEGGPALDLPGELPGDVPAPAATAGGLHLEKSPRQVLETFHFHLFTVPVVLLIVGHLFMLTALSLRLKIVVILVASVGTFVHLLAPLLVRFGGAAWSPLMPLSVIAATIGWLPMTLWPLWEMWTRLPQRVQRDGAGA
ncbi:hypothetical protein [Vulgatibacter sp.]|uniref:hypothetical protein n=1 Tax=Vulgatibacter sp. TaxID=1971226 RepID=UPI0035665992